MAVYVDGVKIPYGRMLMCHMMADSTEELLEMVDKIGVQRKWIEYPGTPREHFNICMAKKEIAIQHGAILCSRHKIGELIQREKVPYNKQ